VFGAIHDDPPPSLGKGRELIDKLVDLTPEEAIPVRVTNYRRWANFPWAVVERGGQPKAGDWTAADRARLKALVDRAHAQGLWIRFYTLDGFAPEENKGWTIGYNFGSEAAARARWQAAIDAGVDFVATDQYELFAATLKQHATASR
jgi:glycerophosphoryl diester phosphodiesterase